MSVFFVGCKPTEEDDKAIVHKLANSFLIDFYYYNFYALTNQVTEKTTQFIDYIKEQDVVSKRTNFFDKIIAVEIHGKEKDSALVTYQFENGYFHKDKHILPLVKIKNSWLIDIENKNNKDFFKLIFDYSSSKILKEDKVKLSPKIKNDIEELVQVFLKQANHPQLIAGVLDLENLDKYGFPDLQDYNYNFKKEWNSLNELYAESFFNFYFDSQLLKALDYNISGIYEDYIYNSFKYFESKLIADFGLPFNIENYDSQLNYNALRWFIKGKNQIVELYNNQDGSIKLSLRESEPSINF